MPLATQPQYASYWNDIIASVRNVYSGALTYGAYEGDPAIPNSPNNEVQQITFWNKLDYVGIDVYPYPLSNHADPSIAELDAGWHSTTLLGKTVNWYQYISQLATSIGKPVLFTETGASSFSGSNEWGANGSPIGKPGTLVDYAEQANYWQSFFDTWAVNKPNWLAGVVAYNMDPQFLVTSTNPTYKEGFTIQGKPAEGIISHWFHKSVPATSAPRAKPCPTSNAGWPSADGPYHCQPNHATSDAQTPLSIRRAPTSTQSTAA